MGSWMVRAGRGQKAVGVSVEVFEVFSEDNSAAFCGADHLQRRGGGGDLQGFLPGRRVGQQLLVEQNHEAPRVFLVQSGVGLVAPFPDVKQHMKST